METLTLDNALEAEGFLQLTGGEATAASSQTPQTSQTANYWSLGLSLVLMIVVFYFFLIRPQKKR